MKYLSHQTLTIACLLILLGGGYIYLIRGGTPPSVPVQEVAPTAMTYTNPTYGVTFQYPDTYYVIEQKLTDPRIATGVSITLLEKGVAVPENGEGPTAITLNIYDKALVDIPNENPLDVWIRSSPLSNFKTATVIVPTQVNLGALDARTYTWDGLYPGTSVVTGKDTNVFMFSVTYNGQTDTMKQQDFAKILTTVTFTSTSTATTTAN